MEIKSVVVGSCIGAKSSQILQASHEQDIRSNREIYDTGDLSEVNFAYNNITFHVYPVLKIANERSSGTDVWLGEKESDSYTLSQE